MCLQMQMNTWSYSCVPITLNLRSHPTGSHSHKWVFYFSFLSYSWDPWPPPWFKVMLQGQEKQSVLSCGLFSKCPQPLLLPEAVYGMSSTTRQSENSSVWVTLQCRKNHFNSLSLFTWIQISSQLTHFFLLPLPTPVSCSGEKNTPANEFNICSQWLEATRPGPLIWYG